MKIKYSISIILVAIVGLLSTVYYYNLDWSVLADLSFYENLANPAMRIIKVSEGMRKEEIADVMGDKLGWDEQERLDFVNAHLALNAPNLEGYYFPKSYILDKDESPSDVSQLMLDEFKKQIKTVKKSKTTKIISEDTALKIASIIQREAAGKNDMKLISGVIWNRLFKGMRLQMDATLQYAKGNEEDGWWQQVDPKDKKIESPYNTYKYSSLPPAPISNPGLAAIEAAYNPQKTDCMYYIHDKYRKIHCATTFEQHKKNIDKYY